MAREHLGITVEADDRASRPLRDVERATERVTRTGQRNERSTRGQSRTSRTLAGAWRGLTAAGRRLDRTLGRLARGAMRVGRALGRHLRRGALIGLAAVTALVGGAVKAYADFDAAMTQSTAIMGDVNAELRSDMERTAREVALSTKFAAAETAEAYYFLASAGMDAEQSMAALPAVATFATAGMFDLARATDLLTDAQSALGKTSDDAAENLENLTRVGDVLVKANTLANASVEQFSEALTNKAGAALKVAGKDVEEGAAVLAAFADQGVKGAAAGEALSITLRDVTRAAQANKGEFAKLGIEVFDTEGNLKNMADVVAELEGGLGGMSDAQLAATLDQLGLTRAVGDSIKLLMGSSDAIAEYEKELRDAGGTMDEVAEKQSQALSVQWAILRGRVADLALGLGQALSPAAGAVVSAFGSLIPSGLDVEDRLDALSGTVETRVVPAIDRGVDRFRELVGIFREADGAIEGTRAVIEDALGPDVLAVFDAVADVVRDVGTIVSDLLWPVFQEASSVLPVFLSPLELARRLLGWVADNAETLQPILFGLLTGFLAFRGVVALIQAWTAAQWLLNAALSANPIGIVITLIAALVAGIIYAYNNSETFRNAVQRLGELLKGAFARAGEIARSIIEKIADVIERVQEWFGRARDRVNDARDALGKIKVPNPLRVIADLAEKAAGALGRAADGARNFASSAGDRVRSGLSRLNPFGDTATSRLSRTAGGAGGSLASTLATHRAISAGGIRVTNATHGAGGSGDHEAGRALDLVGPGLNGYLKRLRDAGGWGEFHGSGADRHLHAVYPSAPAGGGGDTVQVHVHPSPGMDERALARLTADEIERRRRDRNERTRPSRRG